MIVAVVPPRWRAAKSSDVRRHWSPASSRLSLLVVSRRCETDWPSSVPTQLPVVCTEDVRQPSSHSRHRCCRSLLGVSDECEDWCQELSSSVVSVVSLVSVVSVVCQVRLACRPVPTIKGYLFLVALPFPSAVCGAEPVTSRVLVNCSEENKRTFVSFVSLQYCLFKSWPDSSKPWTSSNWNCELSLASVCSLCCLCWCCGCWSSAQYFLLSSIPHTPTVLCGGGYSQ